MSEKMGLITTEWYKPNPVDRSRAANYQIGRTMMQLYGMGNVNFYTLLIREGRISTCEEIEKLNNGFFESSRKIYKLPGRIDAESFYKQARDAAIAGIEYFGRLVPELAQDFELRNEIKHLSARPSDLLKYLVAPEKYYQTLSYEGHRQGVMSFHAGMVLARSIIGNTDNLLSDVLNLLNEDYFKGPEGSGVPIDLESLHDDETNQMIGFPGLEKHRPYTAHLKRQRMIVREVEDIGYVHITPREKEWGSIFAKSWVKALNNGGTVHIDNAVQDNFGMRVVIMDDSIPSDQVADEVVSVIESGIERRIEEKHPRRMPKLVKVERDNLTNGDHGQSKEVNINARRKLWFEGVATPLELLFYNRETFLNSRLEVGERNPQTGLFMGRAHPLYKLREGQMVIRVPFSESIYPVDDNVINMAFVSESKQKAYGLRNMHKAA